MATLPSFRVVRTALSECAGEYEPSGMIGEGYSACLVLPTGHVVWGRFVQVNGSDQTATFEVDDGDTVRRLVVGQRYVYLDGYWGEQAEIVLDPSRAWRQQPFASNDALVYERSDGTVAAKASQAATVGARTLEGGWDHEHCVVCMETIGAGGMPTGWRSTQGDWVCESCYSAYVTRRSLEFVNPP